MFSPRRLARGRSILSDTGGLRFLRGFRHLSMHSVAYRIAGTRTNGIRMRDGRQSSVSAYEIAALKDGRDGEMLKVIGVAATMTAPKIQINRAPVLALWAAVVAERLGR